MGSEICFLLTLYIPFTESLCKVALQATSEQLGGDIREYPLEPMNKALLQGLLPEHLRDVGIIVEVEEILDIVVWAVPKLPHDDASMGLSGSVPGKSPGVESIAKKRRHLESV